MSEFVKRMREIGERWTRKVLNPLPDRSRRRGKLVQERRSWRRMAKGRWIPPRERKGRK
jgi:hypothetical protein